MSHVGFLAEEPDCDTGSDADEASVKTDSADCLLVHYVIFNLLILLPAYFSKERSSSITIITIRT